MLTVQDRAMDAERAEVVAAAMAFPMDAISQRYADEQDLPPEVAREHERELKRFLALCALDPEASYGMNGPVDELWHTFITFTVDYARFCDEVAGHFIHHVPRVDGAVAEPDDGYERMLAAYEETFAEAPPREVWPQRGIDGPAGSSCTIRTPSGSACVPAPSGSACGPPPQGPSGSACFRAP